jgi:site-specific DNA recombinase
MLEDLRNGTIEGIVVYDLDRLARRPVDLEKVIDIYDRAAKEGRQLFFATAQDKIDLASADGLTLARVMVAFANKASRDTARRVALKHREVALTGRPVGGTRPFGWQWTDGKAPLTLKDGRVIAAGKRQHAVLEAEAKVIEQAAQDVLLGVSLTTICRDLNQRGIRTTRGNEWRPGPLRLMLESPRLAGYRVHQGTFIADKEGTAFVKGEWDPILDEDTWQQVFDTLQAKGSGYRENEGRRSYLLSGLLQCSQCGGSMWANARPDGSHFYACKPGTGQKGKAGCGKVTCSGRAVEALVEAAMKQRMPISTLTVHEEDTWPDEEELAATKAQRER